MKDELKGRIMTEFVALRPKIYAYQIDDYEDDDDWHVRKAKGTKKCVTKKWLNLMIIKTVY